MKMHASADHGANTCDHECLAQPGWEMDMCTSPGCTPSQYMVVSVPTG